MRNPLKRRRTRPPAPFVVGVGRSGTTLLRLMLDAHPELAMPPETGFVPDLIAAARVDGATPEDLLTAVTSHRKWGDFGIEPEELRARWAALEPIRARSALRAFFELYAEKQGKPRWGDKTPGYTMHMRQIAKTLPEARFVHVIRDGRAVAHSRITSLSLREVPMEQAARRWRKRVRHARKQGERLDHYLEIRYESLVTEPEATLRSVCDFIELDWDPVMLAYHQRSEERLAELDRDIPAWEGKLARSAESRMALHTQTTKPPDPARIDRWRGEMSAADLVTFESIAGDLLTDLGYPLHGAAPATTGANE
jgi:Sulfotransferase family